MHNGLTRSNEPMEIDFIEAHSIVQEVNKFDMRLQPPFLLPGIFWKHCVPSQLAIFEKHPSHFVHVGLPFCPY